MLEDYRKVMVDRRGEEEQFTSDHIVECMKKGNVGSSFPLRYLYMLVMDNYYFWFRDATRKSCLCSKWSSLSIDCKLCNALT